MPRKAPPRKAAPAAGGTLRSTLGRGLRIGALLGLGVAAGYVWRSYFPLPLPFESKLVADKSSLDVSAESLRDLAKVATTRAEKAERQRDELQRQLADIEAKRRDTERQLADLKVKSVLGQ